MSYQKTLFQKLVVFHLTVIILGSFQETKRLKGRHMKDDLRILLMVGLKYVKPYSQRLLESTLVEGNSICCITLVISDTGKEIIAKIV